MGCSSRRFAWLRALRMLRLIRHALLMRIGFRGSRSVDDEPGRVARAWGRTACASTTLRAACTEGSRAGKPLRFRAEAEDLGAGG
jgi:hypothetical protein